MRRGRWSVWAIAVAVLSSGCNESPTDGNGNDFVEGQILVLNSLSKTIHQFNVSDNTLVPFQAAYGATLNLPANYDGVAMDILGPLMVTTTSALGGSQVIWADLGTGQQITTGFGPNGALADPGRATLILDPSGVVGALVPARAENRIYISFPGETNAFLVATNAGEYVERVLPFGLFVYALDANLDDAGGTYASLGDATMRLFEFGDGSEADAFPLPGSRNITDALFSQEEIIVLAGGTFGAAPDFAPAGDGKLVVVSATARAVRKTLDIGGNGLSIEGGKNGLGHIVRTRGSFEETDILTFNFFTENFERGPGNPIRPKDSDGSDIQNCRAASALVDGRLLCVTFEAATQGRLVLMDASGNFLDDAPVGAGSTDIYVR